MERSNEGSTLIVEEITIVCTRAVPTMSFILMCVCVQKEEINKNNR
jgi:hypothetical protein